MIIIVYSITSINTPVANNAIAIFIPDGIIEGYLSGLSLPTVADQNNILFAYLSSSHSFDGLMWEYTTNLITFDTSTNNFTLDKGPRVYLPITYGYVIQRLAYVSSDKFGNVVTCLDHSIVQRTQCLITGNSRANTRFESTDLLIKTIFFSDNSVLLFNTDQLYIYATYITTNKNLYNTTQDEKNYYTMQDILSPIQGSNLLTAYVFDTVALTKANFVYIEAMSKKFKNGRPT